jgi:hypothetical protein
VNAARKKVQEHYEQSVALQNELAKIKVDILNTQAHNTKLKETMNLLDEELKEKVTTRLYITRSVYYLVLISRLLGWS